MGFSLCFLAHHSHGHVGPIFIVTELVENQSSTCISPVLVSAASVLFVSRLLVVVM